MSQHTEKELAGKDYSIFQIPKAHQILPLSIFL